MHYMNSALKPTGSSIPFLDDVSAQAPRPLLIGRLPRDDAATGLPSPGLTTPESESVVVIDSDSLDDDEMEIVPPPAMQKARRTSARPLQSYNAEQDSLVGAIRAKPSPHLATTPVPVARVLDDEANERDSVVSEFAFERPDPQELSRAHSQIPAPSGPAAPPANLPPNKAKPNYFTEDADHLLIFLKEVKRLKWADITKEFAKDIPNRKYEQLQSRYSQTLNKRDRTQDPPTLNLPPRFASEATIDWQTVHANTAGPRVRTEVADSDLDGASHHKRQQRLLQQARDHDESSGTDSVPQRQRRRRAAPVNYKWPKLRTTYDSIGEDADEEHVAYSPSPDVDVPTCPGSRTSRTLVASNPVAKTQIKPLEMDHHAKDARLGLATHRSSRNDPRDHTPYLSSSQRRFMCNESEKWTWDQHSMRDWQGTVLHVDFSAQELQTVQNVLGRAVPSARHTRHRTWRRHLRACLKDISEPRFLQLAHNISRHLRSRDAPSIISFLQDAAAGELSDKPQIQRLAFTNPKTSYSCSQSSSFSTVVRQRELGLQSRRGWHAASTATTYQIKNQLTNTLGPKSTWTGASGDTHTVAWSPDGQYFTAGAVAVTDTDSMQYNRPNNLMYGDTTNSTIRELGGHFIDRPKAETGANSTHAMHVSQDPRLFTTVTSVAFSPSGNLMYSAGYDHIVCIWNVSERSTQPQIVKELKHKAPVDLLAVNRNYSGVFATGVKRTTDRSVKVVSFDEDVVNNQHWQLSVVNFASAKAIRRPELKMSPTALQFDPNDSRLLLAGFGANMREDHGLDTTGDICLWDIQSETNLNVHGSSRNVFDVTFNPAPRVHSLFAVGCVANGNVNRGTRSVVRFYSTKGTKGNVDAKYTCPLEVECKAFDMNDIVWW